MPGTRSPRSRSRPRRACQDALRSIDASTAQWAALAGATVAPTATGDLAGAAAAGSAQAAGMFTTREASPPTPVVDTPALDTPDAAAQPAATPPSAPLAFDMAVEAGDASPSQTIDDAGSDASLDGVIDMSAFLPPVDNDDAFTDAAPPMQIADAQPPANLANSVSTARAAPVAFGAATAERANAGVSAFAPVTPAAPSLPVEAVAATPDEPATTPLRSSFGVGAEATAQQPAQAAASTQETVDADSDAAIDTSDVPTIAAPAPSFAPGLPPAAGGTASLAAEPAAVAPASLATRPFRRGNRCRARRPARCTMRSSLKRPPPRSPTR